MYQELLGKYHELVKELAAMKRDGFVPGLPDQPSPVAPELPKAVAEAIAEVVESAGYDTDLERTLVARAWAQIRYGVDESAIAEAIRTGEPVEA